MSQGWIVIAGGSLGGRIVWVEMSRGRFVGGRIVKSPMLSMITMLPLSDVISVMALILIVCDVSVVSDLDCGVRSVHDCLNDCDIRDVHDDLYYCNVRGARVMSVIALRNVMSAMVLWRSWCDNLDDCHVRSIHGGIALMKVSLVQRTQERLLNSGNRFPLRLDMDQIWIPVLDSTKCSGSLRIQIHNNGWWVLKSELIVVKC
jgi:hypothetical protein